MSQFSVPCTICTILSDSCYLVKEFIFFNLSSNLFLQLQKSLSWLTCLLDRFSYAPIPFICRIVIFTLDSWILCLAQLTEFYCTVYEACIINKSPEGVSRDTLLLGLQSGLKNDSITKTKLYSGLNLMWMKKCWYTV